MTKIIFEMESCITKWDDSIYQNLSIIFYNLNDVDEHRSIVLSNPKYFEIIA